MTTHATVVVPTLPPRGGTTLRGLSGVDVPVDVVESGRGTPIVFLHGLVGLNEHWAGVARDLSASARCVMLQVPLLELRGEDCSISGVTALTTRFLETHVREPAVVVGNSFGGHVALRIALERPELLRGLVLAGSSGLTERTTLSDIQTRPSREWLARKIGELFFDPANMNPADVERAFHELSDRRRAHAMIKLSRSARRDHLGERIAGIATPTLLIWGKEDVVTPPEAAEELGAKIAGSRLVWLDRCGHAPMIERPREFAAAVSAFLDTLGRAG